MSNVQFLNTTNGIGSFFPYVSSDSLKLDKSNFLPKNCLLFYTGRQAIKYVIESIKKKRQIDTIWLPEYYCQHVSAWITHNYNNVKTYPVNPKNGQKTIAVLDFAKDQDVVLINNFWGIDSCTANKGNKNCIIIEDHSHGWLSKSCRESSADYCIVSLRKSVPVVLGGIAWRPNGIEINPSVEITNDTSFQEIWDNITKGMKLKANYQENPTSDESKKRIFLEIINNEERQMHANFNLVHLTQHHKHIIEEYIQYDYLGIKQDNLKILYSSLKPSKYFEIIKSLQPSFGLILYVDTEIKMQKLRSYLISHTIYPSLLWTGNDMDYGFYLNIHVDFRYNKNSMVYICNTLNSYKETL